VPALPTCSAHTGQPTELPGPAESPKLRDIPSPASAPRIMIPTNLLSVRSCLIRRSDITLRSLALFFGYADVPRHFRCFLSVLVTKQPVCRVLRRRALEICGHHAAPQR